MAGSERRAAADGRAGAVPTASRAQCPKEDTIDLMRGKQAVMKSQDAAMGSDAGEEGAGNGTEVVSPC